MASSSPEEGLSSEELRKKLYQRFVEQGVLDKLKAQLRCHLIHELSGQESVLRPVTVKVEPGLLSACNSIVADHLQTLGYEYSLSVFYPESGLSRAQILKKEDLFQLLKVNTENKDEGCLLSLLTQLTNTSTHTPRRDVETQTTQTDSLSSHGESLVEKMRMIDKEYEDRLSSLDKVFCFQSNLAAYRKEAGAQMEAEMNTKLQHFKEVEIAKVRVEEKAKFHKEFDKMKQDLDRTYEGKSKALMEREKNANDRIHKQQEIEEKNMYMERQLLLKEIESLQTRQNEQRLREEAFEQTCQIREEKFKMSEEVLRRRELAVKTLEDTNDQNMRNELTRYQLELKEKYVKRTQKLTESENRNKVETAQIQKELAVINDRKEEHNRWFSEMKRLQFELETAQQQISLLTQQNELLKERLESTDDCPSLKRDKVELQGQVKLLKELLEGTQKENQQLRAELIKPSNEQLALQAELQRLQTARQVDEEEFNKQKQVLQMQVHSEIKRSTLFKAQLVEYKERSQRMTKLVDDMKMQLRQTHQALENEVLRNPKPTLVDRSVQTSSTDKLVPPDRALLRPRVGYDDVCEAGAPSRRHNSPLRRYSSSDLEKDKARIRELMKEVEIVEEACRSYRQKAANATVSQILHPKPLSPPQAYLSHSPSSSRRKHDSQQSHIHSTLKPRSPQDVQSPTLVSHSTQTPFQFAKPGVSHKQTQTTVYTDYSHSLSTESLSSRGVKIKNRSSGSSKQLSCTSQSTSRRKHQEKTPEGAVLSPGMLPQPQPDGQLSPAPLSEGGDTTDVSLELSLPQSLQLKSRPSTSQSEERTLEDHSEPGHIPELPLDTTVPLSEEAPNATPSPHPRDLPEDPISLHDQAEVPQASANSARIVKEKEDEEQMGGEERRKREERRQRKLKRLKKETTRQPEKDEEEETKAGKGENKEQKEESKAENPLEKYMMIFEAREKQHQDNPVRREEQNSPADRSLSEEKNESFAAYSPKEDDDDDFW